MLCCKSGVEGADNTAQLVHLNEAVLVVARARDARLEVVEARSEAGADRLAVGKVAPKIPSPKLPS